MWGPLLMVRRQEDFLTQPPLENGLGMKDIRLLPPYVRPPGEKMVLGIGGIGGEIVLDPIVGNPLVVPENQGAPFTGVPGATVGHGAGGDLGEAEVIHRALAVAILLPQAIWVADFAAHAVSPTGLITMTDYMFDPGIKLFVRGLSSFHGWLPFVLLYAVWKLGYDRRVFAVQCVAGTALLLACYLFTPGPPKANINYIFGLWKDRPQQWMAPWLWLAALLVVFPVAFYLPAHLVLCRWCSHRPRWNDQTRSLNDELNSKYE